MHACMYACMHACMHACIYIVFPRLFAPAIFRYPRLTAMVFHLQMFNSHYISCLISPSFIRHPHNSPTFSLAPKVADNQGNFMRYSLNPNIHGIGHFLTLHSYFHLQIRKDDSEYGINKPAPTACVTSMFIKYQSEGPYHRYFTGQMIIM